MSTPGALHSKEKTDWGTPVEIVEGARRVMGTIDYDLCSSAYWNRHVVKASRFWSEEESALDGTANPFPRGNYLCNPPGGLVLEFWRLCVGLVGNGSTVFWVGFSVEQMAYLQDEYLFAAPFLRVIPRRRLKFLERRGFLDRRRHDSPPEPAARPSHSNFLVLMASSTQPWATAGAQAARFATLAASLGGKVF